MPLQKTGKKSDIGANIKKLRDEGYDQQQAIAIAMNVGRKSGVRGVKRKNV